MGCDKKGNRLTNNVVARANQVKRASDVVTARRITAVTLAVLAIQNFQFEKKHNLML